MSPCLLFPNGVLCVGNEPVFIQCGRKKWYFEWAACGWLECNADGTARVTPTPAIVWKELETRYSKGGAP